MLVKQKEGIALLKQSLSQRLSIASMLIKHHSDPGFHLAGCDF
jgi:hypothetical protein